MFIQSARQKLATAPKAIISLDNGYSRITTVITFSTRSGLCQKYFVAGSMDRALEIILHVPLLFALASCNQREMIYEFFFTEQTELQEIFISYLVDAKT